MCVMQPQSRKWKQQIDIAFLQKVKAVLVFLTSESLLKLKVPLDPPSRCEISVALNSSQFQRPRLQIELW